ncbi:MAG: PAS domain S-box protein, partial [Pseudomonadota bacterium]
MSRAFEHSMMGVALHDRSGLWIEVNPAFCELLGYGREDLIGQTPDAHTHPDDLPNWLEQRERLLSGRIRGFISEQRYLHADGYELWVNIEALIIPGQGEEPDLIMTQVKDITSTQQMQLALADSEARLQAIIRSMAEGVMAYDMKGGLILSNDRAAEILGMTPNQLQAANRLDRDWHVTHPDGRPFSIEEYPAIITLQTGKPQRDAILRVRKPNGQYVLIEVNTEPVRIKLDGAMIAVVATISDITERTQTQLALEESEERLSLAAEGARLGMWDWHLDDDQIQLNLTATQLINHGEHDLDYRLQDIVAMIHEDDQKRSLSAMTEHIQGRSNEFNVDVRMHRVGEGHVWINLRGRVTKLDDQHRPTRVSGIMMDIDDRKQLLDKLEQLATTDPLTGLQNRRSGSEAMDLAKLHAQRQAQSFSLILMDVDYFKSINDEFGHDAGDQALI